MAEMAAALAAMHRRAGHHEARIADLAHRMVERFPEARPSGAAVELGLGSEEVKGAAGTAEYTLAMLLQQWTGEWPFGALLSQHGILFGGQQLLPLGVAVRHDEGLFGPRCPRLPDPVRCEGGRPEHATRQKPSATHHGNLPVLGLWELFVQWQRLVSRSSTWSLGRHNRNSSSRQFV